MEELTMEEKAKRYEEAIERAEKWRNAPNVDKIPTFANRIIDEIFPEFKESEDDRIRKALTDYFRWNSDGQLLNEFSNREVRAWLEKQGDKDKLIKELGEYKVKYTQEVLKEHIDSMNNKEDDRIRKEIIDFLELPHPQFVGKRDHEKWIAWLEKQGKQKSIDNLTPQEAMDIAVEKCFNEQKPVDNAEPKLNESEDEKIRKAIIHLVRKSNEQGGYALHKDESEKMLAYLEKQGEQNLAWNEEDERT